MENTLSASLIPPTSLIYSTLKENLLPQLNCESCYHNHTTSAILTEETVSDLLLLISGLPAEIYLVWCKYSYIFGEGFCVIRGLAAETSTNASVLTITAFTAERYVAICHPFLSQTMSKLSRAVKLILVIWLVALSFALPQALQFGVVRHGIKQEIVMCTVKRIIIKHSFEMSTFLFFIVPMSLITVLYILIGLKLRKSNMMKKRPGNGESQRSCRHYPGKNSRKILKMLECYEKKNNIVIEEKTEERKIEIDKELNDFTSFTFALIQVMGFNCQQSFTYNYNSTHVEYFINIS
ncbi:pyrokinin-1 receptor-like [Vespula maculifrons]|uniref:Pyrokinin-1 receptor-like n=1 Tax=Vespula maculifrons TaxID=7453 RepID=A0ABD2AMQ7_VESMC